MAAKTGTYTLISGGAISSTITEVIFTSIPSTYTDLVLVVAPTAGAGADLALRFNSDTGTNYSSTYGTGNGTTASSARYVDDTRIRTNYFGGTAGASGMQIIQIMDYANSATNKTVLSRANNTLYGTDVVVGLWRNTSAITSLRIYCDVSGNWTSGNIKLYGIEAAK